jgi:hypothetical protein
MANCRKKRKAATFPFPRECGTFTSPRNDAPFAGITKKAVNVGKLGKRASCRLHGVTATFRLTRKTASNSWVPQDSQDAVYPEMRRQPDVPQKCPMSRCWAEALSNTRREVMRKLAPFRLFVNVGFYVTSEGRAQCGRAKTAKDAVCPDMRRRRNEPQKCPMSGC